MNASHQLCPRPGAALAKAGERQRAPPSPQCARGCVRGSPPSLQHTDKNSGHGSVISEEGAEAGTKQGHGWGPGGRLQARQPGRTPEQPGSEFSPVLLRVAAEQTPQMGRPKPLCVALTVWRQEVQTQGQRGQLLPRPPLGVQMLSSHLPTGSSVVVPCACPRPALLSAGTQLLGTGPPR